MITPQKSGNGQRIFYDDLTYTIGIPEPAAITPLAAGLLLMMRRRRHSRVRGLSAATAAAIALMLLCSAAAPAPAATLPPMLMKTENFSVDPGWDGRNNRVVAPGVPVNQAFGFSATANRAGGAPGEIGGFITPAGEAAFYAKDIGTKTFDDPLSFSGTFNAASGAHVLIGFFNANTVKEWRTPNSLAIRIDGADNAFEAHPEYATSKWRASAAYAGSFVGGSTVHTVSFVYDPAGNGGSGTFTTQIDGGPAVVGTIVPDHRLDGATFNRFGILNVLKHHDSPGNIAIDNLVLNGGPVETFTTDPGWQGSGNRRSYLTQDVRPRFNFGYSGGTSKAGGQSPGEMGGATFRGDSTNPNVMAYYADPLEQTLTLDHPLHASGKVALHRGVTDSAALIGFFHSTESMRVGESDYATPENFIGAAIEGPSSDGFFFYPTFNSDIEDGHGILGTLPYIYPDGASHEWTLDYDPTFNDNRGRITLTLDGQATTVELTRGNRLAGARFDRFGMITTHKDGNGQTVFFDDLTYTVGVPEPSSAAIACLMSGVIALSRRGRRKHLRGSTQVSTERVV
jgi:hypothetical protein